jgi:hypothetical protein
MNNEKPEVVESPEVPEVRRASQFVSVYANNVALRASNWDFRLTFGELIDDGERGIVEQHVAVTMSPQHAKAMLLAFSDQVTRYEKTFGEIKWKPGA